MLRQLFTLITILLLAACASDQDSIAQKQQANKLEFNRVEAAKARLNLALSYLNNQNLPQAKLNLDKALEFAPDLAEVYYSRAFYFQQIGDMKQAAKAYAKSFDLEPNNPSVQHNYGSFLCLQGDYEKAKDLLIAAIKSPAYADAGRSYLNLAYCNLESQRYPAALEYLNKAIKHEPNAEDILLMLASLNFALSNNQTAVKWYRQYQQKGQFSASGLLLGIHIYQVSQKSEQAKELRQKLIDSFPYSPEAQWLKQGSIERSEHWQLKQKVELQK